MITQVYIWLTRPHEEAPADILRTSGCDLLADMVVGHIREPDKPRAGVYGTAGPAYLAGSESQSSLVHRFDQGLKLKVRHGALRSRPGTGVDSGGDID